MTAIDAMRELARRLGQDAALRARAHEVSAESHRKRGMILNVVEIVLSAAVGTTIVAAAMSHGESRSVLYLGLGFIVIAQPLIARLNAFLSNPVHVERHNRSSAAYYALNRLIALQLVDPDTTTADKLRRLVDKVNREFSEISAAGIPLTLRALHRARVRMIDESRLEQQALLRGAEEVAPVQPVWQWDAVRRFVGVLVLPLLATTAVPFLIISSALSPQGKIAAIAVAFALALVFSSSWRVTADHVAGAKDLWSGLLTRLRKPMTIGVVLILGSEMLLLMMSELQHVSDPWKHVYVFTREWSGWIKAGLLSIYAVIVTYLISRQESVWSLERGPVGLAHRSEVTIKGHL